MYLYIICIYIYIERERERDLLGPPPITYLYCIYIIDFTDIRFLFLSLVEPLPKAPTGTLGLCPPRVTGRLGKAWSDAVLLHTRMLTHTQLQKRRFPGRCVFYPLQLTACEEEMLLRASQQLFFMHDG